MLRLRRPIKGLLQQTKTDRHQVTSLKFLKNEDKEKIPQASREKKKKGHIQRSKHQNTLHTKQPEKNYGSLKVVKQCFQNSERKLFQT